MALNKEQKEACKQLTQALELCFYEGLTDEAIQAVVNASFDNWNSGRVSAETKSKMIAKAGK
jgi:hypothetical protein